MVKKTRVLVVDDSALVRKILSELINADPELEVVATAADAFVAREKIKTFNPDVMTLDIEMPKMDGITFLGHLMRLRPMPVVMISSLTEKGAQVTLEALAIGAIDFVAKPKLDVSRELANYADEICEKIKVAAASNFSVNRFKPKQEKETLPIGENTPQVDRTQSLMLNGKRMIAIGASTGGTEAIKEILQGLPSTTPGIVIAQHIPATFSQAFAERVNHYTALTVKQAEDGEEILPGHAYIAPGDRHLLVSSKGSRYYCRLDDGPSVSHHKPSVDVLFRSVSESVGAKAVGLLLTGMGRDGAQGLLEMKQAGASNLIQDESTSVVWGMPGAADKLNAHDGALPLGQIANELIKRCM